MFEQYNIDIQRQLPGGFFADIAYAGSHGVHLQQYSTHFNQIADSVLANSQRISTAFRSLRWSCGRTRLRQRFCYHQPSSQSFGRKSSTQPQWATVNRSTDRRYPQYNDVNLAGYGCCGSTYNSLQATVTRRFAGGGTMLVAYTNSKLVD